MGGAAELGPGEVFVGRYEIQRLLGEGDRKRTYLALDKKMDRLVAISFVKPEAARDDPEGTEREAKVLTLRPGLRPGGAAPFGGSAADVLT